VPSGVLVARLWGKDPRHTGSGRTGGTNVYRTAGIGAAALTVSLDFLKGFFAVEIALWIAGAIVEAVAPGAEYSPAGTYGAVRGDPVELAGAIAGLTAILGHNHSLFLRFRGGAGSTPNLGAAFAMFPSLAVFGLAVSLVVLVAARYASAASLTLSAVLAAGIAFYVAGGEPSAFLVYGLGQLALVVWALRPNIARLRAGTERKIRWGTGSAESSGDLDGQVQHPDDTGDAARS
jgi:glycerol-3-phosphate acyltransferase PlsY